MTDAPVYPAGETAPISDRALVKINSLMRNRLPEVGGGHVEIATHRPPPREKRAVERVVHDALNGAARVVDEHEQDRTIPRPAQRYELGHRHTVPEGA